MKPFRWIGFLALAFALDAARPATAQTTAADRFKAMTDPEGVEKALDKAAKEKIKAPFEFFRSQVAPFDVLPYVKPNHWNTLSVDLRANLAPYDGYLRTAPIRLYDMPHAVAYRRDARLLQDQTARLSLQVMFPQVYKELAIELTRPDAIRPDAIGAALLLELKPHQMLVSVLARDPVPYGTWMKSHAALPASGDKDQATIDKQRYYRMVIPQLPEKPLLSSHPLTWTAVSHVIWDDFDPETLNGGQQLAMLDWLHWGGQLVIVTTVGSSLAPLQESFLGPYLPATASGKSLALKGADLEPLSTAYPPPIWPGDWQDALEANGASTEYFNMVNPPRYHKPAAITPPLNRAVQITGLSPSPDATTIPLGAGSSTIIGAEHRVGRGRILILGFRPTESAFASWPGLDSFLRRVILRRPEESWGETDKKQKMYRFLSGPQLSWYRLLGRDLGASGIPPADGPVTGELPLPDAPVASWLDVNSELPVAARKALETASGITIPPPSFVLKVMLAYIITIVPLNWLVCRYLFRRRELAWVVVPVLSFGFAIGVERLAAHDLGYDSACDEIDLIEIQGSYPRAHVNRFVALYSTGRVQQTIDYPSDPSALVLPMNMQRSLPGEEVMQSVYQTTPEPALLGLPIQPRSLSMYRAEQLTPIGGRVSFVTETGQGKVVNDTDLELKDAVIVDPDTDREISLGTIPPRSTIPIPKAGTAPKPGGAKVDWLDIEPFLKKLRDYRWRGPEDRGERRLVAWTPGPHPGQKLDPKVDRHRGFRLVVAHLAFGPPPDSSRPPYYSEPTAAEIESAGRFEVIKDRKP